LLRRLERSILASIASGVFSIVMTIARFTSGERFRATNVRTLIGLFASVQSHVFAIIAFSCEGFCAVLATKRSLPVVHALDVRVHVVLSSE